MEHPGFDLKSTLLLVWPILVPSMVLQRAQGLRAKTAASFTGDFHEKPVDLCQVGQRANYKRARCSTVIITQTRGQRAANEYS